MIVSVIRDALVSALITAIKTEGAKLASTLIVSGAALLEKRLRGEATDEELMQWLRDAQDAS